MPKDLESFFLSKGFLQSKKRTHCKPCVPCVACDPITKKILNVKIILLNYEDQGEGHFWALDKLCIRLTAQTMPDSTISALAKISGTWSVVPGALTPQSSPNSFCTQCMEYEQKQLGSASGPIKAFEQFFFPIGTQ